MPVTNCITALVGEQAKDLSLCTGGIGRRVPCSEGSVGETHQIKHFEAIVSAGGTLLPTQRRTLEDTNFWCDR
jgi:hypothetical protein